VTRWLLVVPLVFGVSSASCSLGAGSGFAHSDHLLAPECFEGAYDLGPTFFASNPYRDTQTIRIQRKNDIEENSDGIIVLVNQTDAVRSKLGQALTVGLPPEVTPPGVPIKPNASPPLVGLTLYLHETCHGQNLALYAATGTITFAHLFDGDPNETSADEKLTHADFDVMVGDPRDQLPEGGDIPKDRLSHLVGQFDFYFQRGQPAQPFP
jgi:hypothetical protein